jgi:hypothetical protein
MDSIGVLRYLAQLPPQWPICGAFLSLTSRITNMASTSLGRRGREGARQQDIAPLSNDDAWSFLNGDLGSQIRRELEAC